MIKKMIGCAIICILIAFTLCACSSNEKEQCKETVNAFLTAYQAQDETCGAYLAGNEADEGVSFDGFQGVLAEAMTFEIESVQVESDYSTVNVIIKNVDFATVVDDLANSVEFQPGSETDIVSLLEAIFRSEDAPMREFEVAIMLDSEHKIQMTSDLSNALLGGYTQYIYELTTGER